MKPTRDDAMKLLLEYNESDALIQHALQVEAAMIHFANYFNEDVDMWSVVGLCHDLDYEKYPEEHCKKTRLILEENNWDEEYIRGIVSHGWPSCTDEKPESIMEKTLSVLDLELKSLNKKFKDKKFAAGCNREIILNGVEMLNIEKNIVFEETIKGLQERAEICGLKGNV